MQTISSPKEPTGKGIEDRMMRVGLNSNWGRLRSAIFQPAVWVPFVVLILFSAVFRWTALDTAITNCFYHESGFDSEPEDRFPMKQDQPWISLYQWGCYPAVVLGIGGLAVWGIGFFWKRIAAWQAPGLFIGLLIMLGPGLLINYVVKPFWARPRPVNTTLFGGDQSFKWIGQRGERDDDYSFPSGHAAMGFALMAPAFVCYRQRPRWAFAFLALGLAYGCIMGFTRIVAGGHYASDVLWACGIVYFTGILLMPLFRFGQPEQ